jgi:CRISPR type I-E-associated protein CasB/Cse2
MSFASIPEQQHQLRRVRERYDALGAGDRAVLRRCKTEDDLRLEGAYWRLVGDARDLERGIATAVLLFPLAAQRTSERFSFGRYLRAKLKTDHDGTTLRVRRVIQAERDQLAHRLRGLIKLAEAGDGASGIDWGVLGADLVRFGDHVRRTWTQDFFAPSFASTTTTTTTNV